VSADSSRQPISRTTGLRFAAREAAPVGPKAPKPREKKPKVKHDPKLVAAARELRDRWLERINAEGGASQMLSLASTKSRGLWVPEANLTSLPRFPHRAPHRSWRSRAPPAPPLDAGRDFRLTDVHGNVGRDELRFAQSSCRIASTFSCRRRVIWSFAR
jgi:hypothetical protein